MNWSSPCGRVSIYFGDFVDLLTSLPVPHAIVTDPPYGLSFMGKKWDYDVPAVESWRQLFHLVPPGAHLLSFSGTRTYHRMTVNIEDAGFEIRDMIAWVYGSGFPKSLDVSKAIDKAAGAEREVLGLEKLTGTARKSTSHGGHGAGAVNAADPRDYIETFKQITTPATDAARQWEGWGTALKPAIEPIVVARKPLIGTVASNVLEHETGALNIDGCRVGTDKITQHGRNTSDNVCMSGKNYAEPSGREWVGRWPANLIHDGSEEVVELFPVTTSGKAAKGGHRRSSENMEKGSEIYGGGKGIAGTSSTDDAGILYGDSGSAARFFYCAKASKRERGDGNNHPTVKPIELMRYLCRLVTPPNGIILDPFMGSGTTGMAAIKEGFRFIGVEKDPEYFEIAKNRLQKTLSGE